MNEPEWPHDYRCPHNRLYQHCGWCGKANPGMGMGTEPPPEETNEEFIERVVEAGANGDQAAVREILREKLGIP